MLVNPLTGEVLNTGQNCGTGAGGFKKGNTCGVGSRGSLPKSRNETRGYHGEVMRTFKGEQEEGGSPKTDAKFAETQEKVMKAVGERDAGKVRDFLDSTFGRHMVGMEDNKSYIKKTFKKFDRNYDPTDFE